MRSDVHLRPRRFTRIAARLARRAFTLIEIMVVLLIIAILVGLLLVGISAARNTVYQTTTVMELDQIQTALTQYKSDYSELPPSAGEWTTVTTTANATTNWDERRPRLQNHFRRMFPRLTTTFPANSGTPTIFARTYNASGAQVAPTSLDVRNLDAAEAYLFFLNGPPIITNSTSGKLFAFSGWASDPSNPIDDVSGEEERTQRKQVLLEVPNSKLNDQDGDNWPEYYTYNAKMPVVYFRGDQYTYSDGTNTYACAFAMASEIAGMARPYAARAIATLSDSTQNTSDAWVNPTGVQLIVAGQDNLYGEVNANTVNTAGGPARTFPFTRSGATMGARGGEMDNLSNFYGNLLGKAE